MIKFTQGDILSSNVESLVNTVNCVGVMGRGIALQFKKAFPDNFKAYAKACKEGIVQPGKMFVYDIGKLTGPKSIINFPTKRHWRGKSRIGDIDRGLDDLISVIREKNIKSIAIPPLGSGLGGLDWQDVKLSIEKKLSNLEGVEVVVYEPGYAPRTQKEGSLASKLEMTPGRAALVGLIERYLAGLMDPTVTLLEIHKMLYFMQVIGEPLRLKYVKGHYGPYAENLRHVLVQIDGYLIDGYADGSDEPNKEITLLPGAINDAEDYLMNSPDTKERFNTVSNLVEGFETPLGLELLSTVHWVATNENTCDYDFVLSKVHDWSKRKRKFSKEQIRIAMERLQSEGLVAAAC